MNWYKNSGGNWELRIASKLYPTKERYFKTAVIKNIVTQRFLKNGNVLTYNFQVYIGGKYYESFHNLHYAKKYAETWL